MENIKALIIGILLFSSAFIVIFSQNNNTASTSSLPNGMIETSQYSGGVLFENYTQENTGITIHIYSYANFNETVNRTIHSLTHRGIIYSGAANSAFPNYNVTYNIPSEVVNYELSKETQSNLSTFIPNLYEYTNATVIYSNIISKITIYSETFSHYTVSFGTYGTEYPLQVYSNDTFMSVFNRNPAGYSGIPQITPLSGAINQNPNPLQYVATSFAYSSNYTYADFSVNLIYSILNFNNNYLYPVTFFANENNVTGFYLMIMSQSSFNAYQNFSSINNQYVLDFPNGTFFFNVVLIKYKDVLGLNITYYQPINNQFFTVSGKAISINVGLLQNSSVNVSQTYFYIFLIVIILSIAVILKITDGYIMPAALTLNLYLFLGFELKIEFFTTSIIASFMVVIISYFVYDTMVK